MRLNPAPKSRTATRGRGAKPATRRTKTRQAGFRAPRIGRWLLVAVLLLPLALAGGWLWTSGAIARFATAVGESAYALTASAGLAVDDVLVEGRERSDTTAILAALGVVRGTPILSIHPAEAKARLEGLPWVKRAEVARRLPDILHLHLEERQPLALWQLNGELSVIDGDGEKIPSAQASHFASLPLVVGEDAPAHARALLTMLDSQPELARKVRSAVRVSGRRWNLRLEGDIDVRLPEEAPEAAWAKLARFEREHGLLEHDVVMIDLRVPDRLVVRGANGKVPMRPDAAEGKNT